MEYEFGDVKTLDNGEKYEYGDVETHAIDAFDVFLHQFIAREKDCEQFENGL